MTSPRGDRILLVFALAFPALVYFPITANFFLGDDFLYLYRIGNDTLGQLLLNMHGGHALIVRNAIFLLTFELFGTHAAVYFWMVLLTHLLNVFLLFQVVRELTGSARLACFGAALWGILPVQEGTLGWYAVYGHVLVATCTLWVFLTLVRVANGRPLRRLAPLAWAAVLLIGATCFGVGIGTACAMPIVAFLLLPPSRARWRAVLVLAALAIAIPLLYFRMQRLNVQLYGGLSTSVFMVAGLRLYWVAHVKLLLALIACGMGSVLLGTLGAVIPFDAPAVLALVALSFVAMVLVCLGAAPSRRRQIGAALVLCAGGYAVISAGRGILTGMAWGPTVARYHYMGTAALVIAGCLTLADIARRWSPDERAADTLLLTWGGVMLLAWLVVGQPINHNAGARWETEWALRQINRAVHLVPPGRDVYIENQAVRWALWGGKVTDDFPGWGALFTIYYPTNMVDWRRVRFVEDNLAELPSVVSGRRTAGLFVSPDSVSADQVYHPDQIPVFFHITPTETPGDATPLPAQTEASNAASETPMGSDTPAPSAPPEGEPTPSG